MPLKSAPPSLRVVPVSSTNPNLGFMPLKPSSISKSQNPILNRATSTPYPATLVST